MLYVSMQTFALPGTIYLSLLSGALFGVWRGLALVSGKSCALPKHSCCEDSNARLECFLAYAVVSTLGSATCYTLSCQLGRNLAKLVWPVEIEKFAAEVEQRRNDLLNYIIFLRVTPILPNTFINVASPIVNVPLTPFILGEQTFAILLGVHIDLRKLELLMLMQGRFWGVSPTTLWR